ncbi:helix-turn-helix transcriptional regulator [Nocardioides coralli]|uniref:helix-turn-helix transcriptional regulator n=1 Tax=Nocardioides coralli TaxID=2872154 RepID=UPI001CA445C3|nr:LuxR family transcriptional regulator [Nocardioides coralli]QZY30386.1 AAA family ATPase [Nocardioides coralli]
MRAGGHLVGRDAERGLVASVLHGAALGAPSALLVCGEPGIGKTTLIAEATGEPGTQDQLVLWGRCLRFGADSSPFLPFGQILTQWHRQAPEDVRRRILTGADQLGGIAPALGAASSADDARIVTQLTAVLDRIAAERPLVLVVDDLQWADGSSLDLLAYLAAGFTTGQRLAVLATYRDTELAEGHRLHGWLADVLRLPSVSRVHLERLGYTDVHELVAGLSGGTATEDLVADVFRRAAGNPYYTELLAGELGEPGRPGGTGLREALLGSWHRLDAGAREVLQLLAVGGRPVSVDVLQRLAAIHDPDLSVPAALARAAHAGLAAVAGDGEAWFPHPLIAEVVTETVQPGTRRRIHQQYVAVLEETDGVPLASRAAHFALHHAEAGDVDEAFAWSLRAADAAAAVRGYAEAADHLQRACHLWPEASAAARSSAGSRSELWRRASESAWSAGEHELGLRLREEALQHHDVDVDPVGALRLRLPMLHWRELCGTQSAPRFADAERLLAFAERRCPGTPEHAEALARCAFAEVWNDEPEAALRHSMEAVRLARRTGSPSALAWALTTRSQAQPDQERGLADALQAVTLAEELGDPELTGVAAIAGGNCYERLGMRQEAAELLLTSFHRLLATSSVHDAIWASPEFAAALLIDLGRWDEAREVVWQLLSRRHPREHGANVRGVAALLAYRSGDTEAGRTHMVRARELMPGRWAPGDLLALVEVEALGAERKYAEALDVAGHLMPDMAAVDLGGADELLVSAARAAADLAERDRPAAVAQLERLESLRGADAFVAQGRRDRLHPALGSLFRAERARCTGDRDAAAAWASAAESCQDVGLPWHAAHASYHLARTLLASPGSRREATAALRRAWMLSRGMGAAPLVRAAESLAAQVHLTLAEPSANPPSSPGLPELTPREREVLAHVVAGRTYAEIAKELFISEKTVSVHVSNLLRKTGTSSRVELAEMARRG